MMDKIRVWWFSVGLHLHLDDSTNDLLTTRRRYTGLICILYDYMAAIKGPDAKRGLTREDLASVHPHIIPNGDSH